MEKIKLNGNKYIYYDIDKKIIGRTPTESNVKENGSDNSLYMGLASNKLILKVIYNITGDKKMNFSDKIYKFSFYGETIEVHTNINDNGHLQFKVVGNGQMHSMLKKYKDYIGEEIELNNLIILLDFCNFEIYFEEISTYENYLNKKNIKKAEKEIEKIVKNIKKEYSNLKTNNVNGYIETILTVRNNAIQKNLGRIYLLNLIINVQFVGWIKKNYLLLVTFYHIANAKMYIK